MSELAKWDSFYAIVGSAADALIGLQFVVATLIPKGLHVESHKVHYVMEWTQPHFETASMNGPGW
jgi:hypothetical protein